MTVIMLVQVPELLTSYSIMIYGQGGFNCRRTERNSSIFG
jgi:hypothetical protein